MLFSIFKSAGLIAAPTLFFGAAPVNAQESTHSTTKTPYTVVALWPANKMPGPGADKPEADMPARGDGVQRVTNVSNPTLTLFPAKAKKAPAIIVCPGGGYSYVVPGKEGSEVAAWFNSVGITALVLKYRVPNNREGALQDIQRAISLTRANARKWNIDPKRLGVMGFSAGGNLAAKASMLFDQRSYQAIDSIDKQSARPDFAVLVYPAYLEKDGKVSPDLYISRRVPPTYITGTEGDKVFISGGKIYHSALDEVKVPNKLVVYPGGGHGYGLYPEGAASAWPQSVLEWLREIGISKVE